MLKKQTKKQNFTRLIVFSLLFSLVSLTCFQGAVLADQDTLGGQEEVDELNQEISQKKKQIEQLQERVNEYQKNLDYQRRQSVSLSNQVEILNNEIGKLETEIELKQGQIEQSKLEITKTEDQIKTATQNITTKKQYLANYLKQVYKEDQKSSIELILTLDSFSDYYNHLHSLGTLQDKTKQALEGIKEEKEKLENSKKQLQQKQAELANYLKNLENDKAQLDSRSYTKENLLAESRNSEVRFKQLVTELKAEQNAINSEIVSLEKTIRQRLKDSGQESIQLRPAEFIWPVPNRGITAYFHDPSYPFRYLFEHPAIDIKSSQGSPIKAPADGYVGKVRINGTNYGYIMLIHSDGFSTVFGHTSKSYVKEDEYVRQGEVIGLSGGMPGTTGSGRLSTGPHLHFEIRKNGIPVNPLNYLP